MEAAKDGLRTNGNHEDGNDKGGFNNGQMEMATHDITINKGDTIAKAANRKGGSTYRQCRTIES